MIGCNVKSFKTTCLESSKTISEVKYKYIPEGYSPAIIEKIYGRLEDLQKVFSVRNFKQNKIDFNCNENVLYDDKNDIFYAQGKNDERKFYYLYSDDIYEKKLSYKGTQNIKDIKRINLNDPKKYLLLYNKEYEKDDNYEVTYNYYGSGTGHVYTFHQRGNEFDEYTYEYEKDNNFIAYKNGALWKESSTFYEDGIEESTITQHIISESYQFDRKNRPFLKESRFTDHDKTCNCKEGYVTKIEFWLNNKCQQEYILE
ncbi:hypothetical protein GCM10023210_42120 [Chryseobacterium ginsengisoli]|uniref:Sugar-binding protein n=2 Tax=Chryseobacterium ginsengisoli TaxID=363853 RepID=A0ABP9MYC8_9FLAO